NQLRTPNGDIITFNDEQYEAINKIRYWLENSDGIKNFFTLAGMPGSGKTTVIKKILDEYNGLCVVSAPTHKAKKIIINTTQQEGLTLHGLLGLRPDINLDDFNPNDPKFNPIALPKICDYGLVVIDEASMINEELYNLIKKQTKGMYTKVLFMGDPAQIPPINEGKSIVFDNKTNEFYELTKIERQNELNPITKTYELLRNNLSESTGGYIKETQINDDGEGIVFTKDKRHFRDLLFEQFKSKEFNINTDHCKMVAWTNNTVRTSNKIIRNELFGENADIVEVGDVLMGYRTITGKSMHHVIIENSADYKVIEKGELRENEYGIKGYDVKIRENSINNTFKYEDIFIVDCNDEKNLHKYAFHHDQLRDKAKSNKKLWNLYYKFRRKNLLMENIFKHENGIARDKRDIIVKDLDYGYSVTCHKVQGSTYNYIYVLEDDIDKNWNVNERNQIKYVALTRPTKSAIVLYN
ncbi:MAG: AAA family ATPase, partial [bacterium]